MPIRLRVCRMTRELACLTMNLAFLGRDRKVIFPPYSKSPHL